MTFRHRVNVSGIHVIVQLFVRKDANRTFAKAGDFHMSLDEWAAYRSMLVRGVGGNEVGQTIDVEWSED